MREQTIEILKLVASYLGPAVTLGGFIFVIRQLDLAKEQLKLATDNYRLAIEAADRNRKQEEEKQAWKKSEFIANQVATFFSDETVDRVIKMCDWNTRIMFVKALDRNILFLHDYKQQNELDVKRIAKSLAGPWRGWGSQKSNEVYILEALRDHAPSEIFTELEAFVRDEFDIFLFKLGQFNSLSKAGLFTFDEIEVHLRYVLDLLSGGRDHVPARLAEVVTNYAARYDFVDALALVRERQMRRTTETKRS